VNDEPVHFCNVVRRVICIDSCPEVTDHTNADVNSIELNNQSSNVEKGSFRPLICVSVGIVVGESIVSEFSKPG